MSHKHVRHLSFCLHIYKLLLFFLEIPFLFLFALLLYFLKFIFLFKCIFKCYVKFCYGYLSYLECCIRLTRNYYFVMECFACYITELTKCERYKIIILKFITLPLLANAIYYKLLTITVEDICMVKLINSSYTWYKYCYICYTNLYSISHCCHVYPCFVIPNLPRCLQRLTKSLLLYFTFYVHPNIVLILTIILFIRIKLH